MFALALGLLLIVLGMMWAFLIRNQHFSSVQTTAKPIPKQIWSYWHSPDLPRSVQLCKQSWERSMPDYTIHLLNKDTIKNFLDKQDLNLLDHPRFNDSHARFADMLRLCLLAKHGGLWLDSTIFLGRRLEIPDCDLFGYYLESFTKHTPVLESWLFAAPEKSHFVQAWKKEFSQMAEFDSVEKYVDDRLKKVDVQKIDVPNYLAIHVSAQCLLQGGFPRDHLIFLKAEDGPYALHCANKWDSKKTVNHFMQDPHQQIVKFRGHERAELDKQLEEKIPA